MHVVQVNRLRVQGFLNISEFAPEEVMGRPVTVKVVFARGRTETFNGNIVFVDPMVEARRRLSGSRIDQESGRKRPMAASPGMDAEMTIQLK